MQFHQQLSDVLVEKKTTKHFNVHILFVWVFKKTLEDGNMVRFSYVLIPVVML